MVSPLSLDWISEKIEMITEKSRLFALVCLFFIAACEEKADVPASADVLARIHGVDITARQLEDALEILYPGTRPEGSARRALQRLIDFELLVKEAKALGLENDPRVTTVVQLAERELLLEELYERNILKRVTKVSDQDARDYFERNRLGEERRLSRILVSSADVANRIRERLDAGEDFALIASEVLPDPKSAAEGGDIGWMSPLTLRNPPPSPQRFCYPRRPGGRPDSRPGGLLVLQGNGGAATALRENVRRRAQGAHRP